MGGCACHIVTAPWLLRCRVRRRTRHRSSRLPPIRHRAAIEESQAIADVAFGPPLNLENRFQGGVKGRLGATRGAHIGKIRNGARAFPETSRGAITAEDDAAAEYARTPLATSLRAQPSSGIPRTGHAADQEAT